ncbi:cyclic nucleotide-binding domain-containing protein [Magnetovibrio sp. PR-2]|uniref:Crp/Fnr family transcriptional regulator n=1 Tax=Magnetovibrio sp. PR-2 TaxID=3120356 RepID=UPI002FCDE37E
MKIKTYMVGDTIFKEGEAGELAYLIRSGEVKITKMDDQDRPSTIANLKKGNIIGEMALIDDAPRAASAISLDKTEVMVITKEEFQKRLANSDQVIGLLLQTFTQRLRQQAERAVNKSPNPP